MTAPNMSLKSVIQTAYDIPRRIHHGDESAVTGVWNLLLNHYFNQRDGFVHRSEDKVEGGYVDMSSYQWVVRPNQPRRVRTPFLVTQCKRTARENDKATWAEGFDQLKRYMRHMVAQHPWRHPQYGIIAVGRYVEFYKWDAAKSVPVLYAGRDLKESGQGAQLLWLDADELERTYRFREKEEWVGTYRLIYFDRSSQAYRLSGIAHLADPIETFFKAPIDRNQACIGLTNRDPSGLVRYHVQNVALWSSSLAKPVDWREFAFAVHASCWSLTLRFVDADVENHLYSILAVSLKRMTELHSEEFPVWDSWTKKRRAQDPFRIPVIGRLIEECKRRRAEPAPALRRSSRVRSRIPRLNLPCDILCLILDRLDYLSVRRFCQAVHCPPMDSYWRGRAAPHLLELDEIRHEDLDWRHLCLEIEKLRRSSESFWTRDRTLKILRHNKDAYLRNLKKAQPLTPKDVINHIQYGVGRDAAFNRVFKYPDEFN
ncbi:hypothetical protein CNMCM7691_007491 [Aspergillus felis]|uniref:Uncharacterized protein n=1 Tax=Aspergillus felis TaxID=1287682 RepID=A0A8H6V5L7_9EURO|nr:hypothetical protein CNMCM7691_007491 [Aspergillus felis]